MWSREGVAAVQAQYDRADPVVTVWPQARGDGSSDVAVEYELEASHLELRNVVISVPIPYVYSRPNCNNNPYPATAISPYTFHFTLQVRTSRWSPVAPTFGLIAALSLHHPCPTPPHER